MWRHLAANALTFFVVALFLIAGLVAWGQSRWAQPGPLAQAICFQVPSGANMRRIGASLAERGAIESIFAVLALRDQICPPTINLDDPAVETPVDLAPNAPREREVRVAVNNSFGFGGTNASLVLGQAPA